MDQIKIGKYIAGKRKDLGLTQKQLAEQLGMSDKSVSKWERGVCLPDVSVYAPLCAALGVSISEFLAGEDISRDELPRRAEDNLIQVSTDSRRRQRKLKWVIAALAVIAFAAAALVGAMLWQTYRPQNYITPLGRDSAEMQTAELLAGRDSARLYRFRTTDRFRALSVWCTEYRNGERTGKTRYGLAYGGGDPDPEATAAHLPSESPAEGMIVLVPDVNGASIRLILAGSGTRYAVEIPAFGDLDPDKGFVRGSRQIEEETPIRFGEEQELAAFVLSSGARFYSADISDFQKGNDGTPDDYDYDYVYVFSVRFEK
jgi:transcriptional regulator with XRE-family HTH domain